MQEARAATICYIIDIRMSGDQMLELLSAISYPRATSLEGPSLDWMYEIRNMSPLLEWMAEEFDSTNVLSVPDCEECVKNVLCNIFILLAAQSYYVFRAPSNRVVINQ